MGLFVGAGTARIVDDWAIVFDTIWLSCLSRPLGWLRLKDIQGLSCDGSGGAGCLRKSSGFQVDSAGIGVMLPGGWASRREALLSISQNAHGK